MSFAGFRDETFAFFRDLGANNTEAWFAENEHVFKEHVREPCLNLVETLGEFISGLDVRLKPNADPATHLSKLERTGETLPDAGAYKTTQYVYFWNTELARLNDGTLHVGVGSEGVSIGFSIYEYGLNRRARMNQVFKARLSNDLELLDNYIKASYLRRGFTIHRYARAAGRLGLKEVEAFPSHSSAWENTLGWVVGRHIHTGSSRLTPGSFLSELQESFTKLYPLYLYSSDPRVDWKREFKKHF